MAQTDWSYLNNGLDISTVDRGVTHGIARPNGGGDFVFAFNSLSNAQGAVGLYCNLSGFSPMVKGGSIRGCIQRGPGAGSTGFSPFFFMCCQGTSVNDQAYMLGLCDDEPHRIVLRKGLISAGIPSASGTGVLMASGASFLQGTWLHLRLDVIVNDNGDVILQVFQNDLDSHALGSQPVWVPVPSMTEFIDDHVAINSGSQPLTSGRAGFGITSKAITRRMFFDHIELHRQVEIGA